MSRTNSATCSFTVDREIYDAYKRVVANHHENVRGNLTRYMMNVVRYNTPNADTIEAIEEVRRLKADPDKKTYSSFNEILAELDDE